jgi:nucleoside-diphosphate-sugar epimerase
MYAYGPGEAQRRLFPSLKRSIGAGDRARIFGSGSSFLNPLHVDDLADFVAKLVQSGERPEGHHRKAFVMNVNHPAPLTVREAAELVVARFGARFVMGGETEDWPVRFFGDSDDFVATAERFAITIPDHEPSIARYIHSLGEHR